VFVPRTEQEEAAVGEQTKRQSRIGLPGRSWDLEQGKKSGSKLLDVKGNDDEGPQRGVAGGGAGGGDGKSPGTRSERMAQERELPTERGGEGKTRIKKAKIKKSENRRVPRVAGWRIVGGWLALVWNSYSIRRVYNINIIFIYMVFILYPGYGRMESQPPTVKPPPLKHPRPIVVAHKNPRQFSLEHTLSRDSLSPLPPPPAALPLATSSVLRTRGPRRSATTTSGPTPASSRSGTRNFKI
jgi:hypothetical protein